MTLIAILVATAIAGIGSVWLAAALLALRPGPAGDAQTGVGPAPLLSLAAGALLATAFMHLLPEAFESGRPAGELFAALLAGLVFFFILDKAELWHHGHEHHHDGEAGHGHAHGHAHEHAHGHRPAGRSGVWALLAGDSVHCFGDGILIASAFVADLRLGALAALAVLAHEVPHHVGDLVVLRWSGSDLRAAMMRVSLAGTVTCAGGLAGWLLLDTLAAQLPFFLVLASSSFVYVALADLIPQLQKRLSARQTIAQVAALAIGIAIVTAASALARH